MTLPRETSGRNNNLYDSVIKGIKELGFPVVMSIALLYNGWSTQTYLISVGEKRDQQINALSDAVIKLAQSQAKLGELATENNGILRGLALDSAINKKISEIKTEVK